MAEKVEGINCPAFEWTPIVEDEPAAFFQWRDRMATGKCTFGATAPDVDTLDYWTVWPRSPQNFNELSSGVKIWAMPIGGADQIMEVITQ